MAKKIVLCGFCNEECKPDEDVGFLKFPDGEKRPVHIRHHGVKEEYEKQMGEK